MIHPQAPVGCMRCLCEVCDRMNCPKVNRRYKAGFCASMLDRERCPVLRCDYFAHKQKRKAYRVVRRARKRDQLLERLDFIEARLRELFLRLP